MMTLHQLYERAYRQGIEIDEVQMRELVAVSFPEGWIAIDRRKIETLVELKCILAHEIAHIETGSFYNVWSPFDLMEKCERKANRRAVGMLMPLAEVRDALRAGYSSPWALAAVFDVTEDFARLALEVYGDKLQMAVAG